MLILASGSPRRHQLLLAAGIDHSIDVPSVVEDRMTGEGPEAFVQRLAKEKAHAVTCGPEDAVLGADTIVSLGSEVLGKPVNDEDAARMLRLLSGRHHYVLTGICLRSQKRSIVDFATTRVSIVKMTEAEIEQYIASGEPKDKAGAYAIQGLASKFVCDIHGCYHNVVGLPISLVYRHMKAL
jgi:septum formation protein